MNSKYIGMLLLVLVMASCSKWLDVVPKNLVTEEDLFKDGLGYRNALNGVYKYLGSTQMYGKELTYGSVDAMGQCYVSGENGMPETSVYATLMLYQYDKSTVKSMFESIWKKSYKAIANCNNIINTIDKEPIGKFIGEGEEKNMILGEALALRALIHFDMLRLFAAAPVENSSDNYIPYYTTFPDTYESARKTSEIIALVEKDLLRARDLVAPFDTLVNSKVNRKEAFLPDKRFRNFESDIFYGYRGYRMNYLAICGLLARVYNYDMKQEEAYAEAMKVIDFKTSSGTKAFSFTPADRVAGNPKLSHDVLFTASDPKLYFNYLKYVTVGKTSEKFILNTNFNELFTDGNDNRKRTFDTDGGLYWSMKNIQPRVPNDDSEMISDMMPILRLSEMYYIVAEYYASKGDFSNATEALDAVRIGRGCNKGGLIVNDITTFHAELSREVFKEFFGEGQRFFYFKKLGLEIQPGMDHKLFIVPIPDSQDIN